MGGSCVSPPNWTGLATRQRLLIRDTGHGIPQEIMDHIFDPFFTTKEEEKGTGLGLSIVYGVIKNHKGHISVDSQVGEGASFLLTFPLA